MENPVVFGLGLTGTAGVLIGILWMVIQKGIKSKCRIAGEVITLDIHKETPGDQSPPLQPRRQSEVDRAATIPV
jgi:hypothetical protein